MSQTDAQRAMAELLVEALELDDVAAPDIDPTAPLFGHDDNSLGLDSIDALEIALAIAQKYGVELKADDENNKVVFASLASLTEYVSQ